jgi:hypothetical protein
MLYTQFSLLRQWQALRISSQDWGKFGSCSVPDSSSNDARPILSHAEWLGLLHDRILTKPDEGCASHLADLQDQIKLRSGCISSLSNA